MTTPRAVTIACQPQTATGPSNVNRRLVLVGLASNHIRAREILRSTRVHPSPRILSITFPEGGTALRTS